jgi:hypothetical protein
MEHECTYLFAFFFFFFPPKILNLVCDGRLPFVPTYSKQLFPWRALTNWRFSSFPVRYKLIFEVLFVKYSCLKWWKVSCQVSAVASRRLRFLDVSSAITHNCCESANVLNYTGCLEYYSCTTHNITFIKQESVPQNHVYFAVREKTVPGSSHILSCERLKECRDNCKIREWFVQQPSFCHEYFKGLSVESFSLRALCSRTSQYRVFITVTGFDGVVPYSNKQKGLTRCMSGNQCLLIHGRRSCDGRCCMWLPCISIRLWALCRTKVHNVSKIPSFTRTYWKEFCTSCCITSKSLIGNKALSDSV